ncbi:MAG: EAL domain-containing response regulator [Alphaproteobacteria bacterium]|nr:EAL domain-containing response regulator [Alphaproteobacteria bacterium]MCL2505333.1 EAL domain-containing response regulator [Alphaproteobacteria bacterium]
MKLLIIDDEEDICDVISEIAQQRGFETKSVTDASNISQVLNEFTPDLIMLDLLMPGTDGVELLRTFADKVKDVQLCLMSGSDARVLSGARRLGSAHGLNVIDALEKPLEVGKLKEFFDSIASQQTSKAETVPYDDKDSYAKALANEEFTLFYQPIVDLSSRKIKGFEALARWNHPSKGILLPDAFLREITNDGLMQELTDFVIRTAVKQTALFYHSGQSFTMAVNITASTLLDLSLPDKISDICSQHNLPTDQLILEVTETEAMKDVTRTMDVLLRMRLKNIGVSIDDFGTGHSSLKELQRMPFSELKIDRSFISDITRNHEAEIISRSIIDLGHNLGLQVVAEGIENHETMDMLVKMGCDLGQGFAIGHPMKASNIDAWIDNWNSTWLL